MYDYHKATIIDFLMQAEEIVPDLPVESLHLSSLEENKWETTLKDLQEDKETIMFHTQSQSLLIKGKPNIVKDVLFVLRQQIGFHRTVERKTDPNWRDKAPYGKKKQTKHRQNNI